MSNTPTVRVFDDFIINMHCQLQKFEHLNYKYILREFQYASSNFLILFINQTFRDFFIENKLFFFEYFYVLVSA
jgi:hypothetical protein